MVLSKFWSRTTAPTPGFPPELDIAFYRRQYPRLALYSDAGLRRHYEEHGRAEGRQASPAALREGFVAQFEKVRPLLEIGPFDRPMVTGEGVSYFDVLDQEGLIERAGRLGRNGIDFVSPTGDLSIVDQSFAAACSAHCLEHQPDMIAHLKQVGRVLQDGGNYFLVLPDKRYCFDHFIPETTIADIIEAHEEKRTVHTLANVVKHVAETTHNDTPRHWAGDHADPGFEVSIRWRINRALKTFRAHDGSYIDVHAWRFSPATFRSLMNILSATKRIPFQVSRVYDTPRPQVEFMAILQKSPAT